jgi:hypothetical protein
MNAILLSLVLLAAVVASLAIDFGIKSALNRLVLSATSDRATAVIENASPAPRPRLRKEKSDHRGS